jgi:hypothetical protein
LNWARAIYWAVRRFFCPRHDYQLRKEPDRMPVYECTRCRKRQPAYVARLFMK